MTGERGGHASRQDVLRMTTDIVSAYAGKNSISSSALTGLIEQVHAALDGLALNGLAPDGAQAKEAMQALKPAVPVRRSVNPDYIVCLEDGRKLKMLKRYLRAAFHMTPEEYRVRWGLPEDYPMVAPNYAKKRSEFAKKMGLGKR